jgi:hypothetical protein
MNFIHPQFQNEAEAQQYRAWARTRTPKAFVRDDLVEESYWARVKAVLDKCKAKITVENLVIAGLALVEEDRAQAREQERKQRVFADVEAELAKVPDFDAGDQRNVDAALTFFSQNPNATAADFMTDISLHPDRYHWHSGRKGVDLVAKVRTATPAQIQELRRVYGSDAIDGALLKLAQRMHKGSVDADSHLRHEGQKTAAEQQQEVDAAQRKHESDPREIERAKSRVESLINGVRISNNHRENYEAKAYLRGLQNSFTKDGAVNWFRYEEAVKAHIDHVTSTSIR